MRLRQGCSCHDYVGRVRRPQAQPAGAPGDVSVPTTFFWTSTWKRGVGKREVFLTLKHITQSLSLDLLSCCPPKYESKHWSYFGKRYFWWAPPLGKHKSIPYLRYYDNYFFFSWAPLFIVTQNTSCVQRRTVPGLCGFALPASLNDAHPCLAGLCPCPCLYPCPCPAQFSPGDGAETLARCLAKTYTSHRKFASLSLFRIRYARTNINGISSPPFFPRPGPLMFKRSSY